MPNQKQFPFPPLQEVAFEITFAPKLKVLANIAEFQDLIANDYPEIKTEEVAIVHGSSPIERINQKIQFSNPTDGGLVRIAVNSFNVVVQSYKSFDTFSETVLSLWGKFQDVMGSVNMARIGLRYVNKLELPFVEHVSEAWEYVNPYFVSDKFSKGVMSTVKQEARLVFDDTSLTIRSGLVSIAESGGGGTAVYMLDYDGYREGDGLQSNIQEQLAQLHQIIEERFLADVQPSYIAYMETGTWK